MPAHDVARRPAWRVPAAGSSFSWLGGSRQGGTMERPTSSSAGPLLMRGLSLRGR
jgi:hypothetical protein